jgi:hypothetical protein
MRVEISDPEGVTKAVGLLSASHEAIATILVRMATVDEFEGAPVDQI